MVNLDKCMKYNGAYAHRMMEHIGAMGKVHTMIGDRYYSHLLRNDLDSLRMVFMYDYSNK